MSDIIKLFDKYEIFIPNKYFEKRAKQKAIYNSFTCVKTSYSDDAKLCDKCHEFKKPPNFFDDKNWPKNCIFEWSK